MEKRSENQSVKFWLLGTEEAVGGRTVKKTFTLLLLACNMMMLAMLSLVPIETHLGAAAAAAAAAEILLFACLVTSAGCHPCQITKTLLNRTKGRQTLEDGF